MAAHRLKAKTFGYESSNFHRLVSSVEEISRFEKRLMALGREQQRSGPNLIEPQKSKFDQIAKSRIM